MKKSFVHWHHGKKVNLEKFQFVMSLFKKIVVRVRGLYKFWFGYSLVGQFIRLLHPRHFASLLFSLLFSLWNCLRFFFISLKGIKSKCQAKNEFLFVATQYSFTQKQLYVPTESVKLKTSQSTNEQSNLVYIAHCELLWMSLVARIPT